MSVTQPTVVDISEPIVWGNDFTFTGTLTASGTAIDLNDGGAATVTTSLYDERDPVNKLLADVALAVSGGSAGEAVLTLTDVQTKLLHAYFNDPKRAVPHIADFKVVSAASGNAVPAPSPWMASWSAPVSCSPSTPIARTSSPWKD